MQSKAVEGFMKDALNPSNFVLQLPAHYAQSLHKPTGQAQINSVDTIVVMWGLHCGLHLFPRPVGLKLGPGDPLFLCWFLIMIN